MLPDYLSDLPTYAKPDYLLDAIELRDRRASEAEEALRRASARLSENARRAKNAENERLGKEYYIGQAAIDAAIADPVTRARLLRRIEEANARDSAKAAKAAQDAMEARKASVYSHPDVVEAMRHRYTDEYWYWREGVPDSALCKRMESLEAKLAATLKRVRAEVSR